MRIAPDSTFLPGLSRPSDSARADKRAQEQSSFDTAVSGRDPAAAAQAARQVNATAKAERLGERPRDSAEPEKKEFQPLFAREAPNGMRPKYVPKGQVLNMLV